MSEAPPSIGPGYRLMASLPLALRRRAVRALFRARALGLALTGRREKPVPYHLFQQVLRLPRREALRLDREMRLHDLTAETEWLALSTRSLAGIRRDMGRIRVQDDEILTRLAGEGRPVILAPLHMGAYVMGLAHTMITYFPGRPLLILRQRDDLAMETRVMERIREFGVEMRFLNVSQRAAFLSAVRFAQQGAVIVVFCDLPPSYGAPMPMPLFGMPFRFAFGVDTLARLTGAAVVPWVTTMERGGDRVRIGRPFEVRDSAPEERTRVAALMREHLRTALRARPDQWHLWPAIADYLPPAGSVDRNAPESGDDGLRSAA